jgi:hypothetical protein
MVDTMAIVYCRQCRSLWGADGEPGCTDASHQHTKGEAHRHRDAVDLPDGTRVIAVSYDPNDPYTRDQARQPDFGLYLDPCWSPPWPHDHVDWPDFGVPASADELRQKLSDLVERSRRGEVVELGCLGSHGRTGTALACLAVITGVAPDEAVAWVRRAHCEKAVETDGQAAFAAAFGGA